MRKLASIQTVNAVEPIPNADAIERIRVLGWWIVAKKGEFRLGDPLVYCEIDSLLPERAEFEFLRANSYKPAQPEANLPAGFRIRTVKLRGQVSQGICFPLSILPPTTPSELGADVTAALGVHKWEQTLPARLSGKIKGAFPAFLSKTDETRVQVLESVLQAQRGKTFYLTEKLDGSSFSAFVRRGEFGVCSRNYWLDETDTTSTLVRTANSLDLAARLQRLGARLGHDVAIQAELIGPAIQGNKYGLKSLELRVFNVLNLDEVRLLDHDALFAAIEELGLASVPRLGTLTLHHGVDELIALSEGMSVLNSRTIREGIVLRPLVEEHDPVLGGRLSFKAINPKFLLKFDE
jgi:RNA ligase (TIGR02306 family)